MGFTIIIGVTAVALCTVMIHAAWTAIRKLPDED